MKTLKIIGFSVLGIILLFMLIIGGFIGYVFLMERMEQKEKEKVEITVEYDPSECSPEYPLAVRIYDGSKKTILNTEIRIKIYRKGHSSDISHFSSQLKTDKIIEPNKRYRFCVRLLLDDKYKFVPIDELEFEIGYTYIRFE